MDWIRHDYDTKNTKWVLGFLFILFFMTMVFLQYTEAAVIAFIASIIGLQQIYFSHAGKKLKFENARSRKRVLNGGDSEWELSFQNKGLPIWGGKLKIWFQHAVEPAGDRMANYSEVIEMDIPFTIGINQTLIVKVPLTGARRGLSRIKKMELEIPHPFGEGNIVLEYRHMILQDHLVYPKLQKYPFSYMPSRQKPGQFNLRNSLFDDAFQPIGTRDYVSTDQFNQIHWKASARMPSYQTKIFAQVANESLLFVLNVAERYATISNLEDRIEELASYIENCYSESVPFAIAVNIRSAGKMPYLYLQPGTGQKQRQNALELLSVISKNNSTLPFRSMIAHLDLHIELPFTTYLMTDEFSDIHQFSSKWHARTELKVLGSRKGSGIA